MDMLQLFDFSLGEQLVLISAGVLFYFLLVFDEKYKRSESLVLKAEQGDDQALRELIRLDLLTCEGVILVAENSQHYGYCYFTGEDGLRHRVRYLTSSFPSREFLALYMRELGKGRAGQYAVERALHRLEHCRAMSLGC